MMSVSWVGWLVGLPNLVFGASTRRDKDSFRRHFEVSERKKLGKINAMGTFFSI